MSSKEDTGDIIKFYNSVFIPQLESFLVQFSAAPALTTTPAVPLVGSASPFVMPHSPLRLGANLSVSSPAATRTPSRVSTPRVLYSFGQSPSKVYLSLSLSLLSPPKFKLGSDFVTDRCMQNLQVINQTVNSPSTSHQPRRETRVKRHLFQNTEDDSLGPPASPSLQRKLTELGWLFLPVMHVT